MRYSGKMRTNDRKLSILLLLVLVPFITGCLGTGDNAGPRDESSNFAMLPELDEQGLQDEALNQLENDQGLLKTLVLSSGIAAKKAEETAEDRDEYFSAGLKSVTLDRESSRGMASYEFIYDHPLKGRMEGEIALHFRNERGSWVRETARGKQAEITRRQVRKSSIAGTVKDGTDGIPIPGAEVFGKRNDRFVTRIGVTDANGEFLIEDVPVGSYQIHVSVGGTPCSEPLRTEVHPATPCRVDLGIRLPETEIPRFGVFTGRVVDCTGTAVSGASIRPVPLKGWMTGTTTDRDGCFKLEMVPEGDYELQICKDSAATRVRARMTLDSISRRQEVPVRGIELNPGLYYVESRK